MAEPSPTAPQSYLQLVEACDNFSPTRSAEKLVPWRLTADPSAPALGLLRPSIVAQLRAENARAAPGEEPFAFALDGPAPCVGFASWADTPAKRSGALAALLARWRDEGLHAGVIGPRKWRGELYPVFRRPFGVHDAPRDDSAAGDGGNYAFCMERAACALFGVVTYGVHMNVFVKDGAGPAGCRVWVPKRAKTKQTWPGYFDNSVAGGIPAGYSPFESLVKESMEEASLAEDIVRKHAKSVGSISYFFSTSEGWLQPEVEYLYDLEVPADADPAAFQPKPLDGEVESFELLSLEEIIPKMRAGLFKTNCATALIDFMVRHGYITPDNEPDFQEIITRLHGRFEYDRW
ncbi:nudix hydrolase domain-containing protein [Phanerochaete sordida]|uniref:Nudix hydrolase domain-containing protein n=1 Tax=Phanerochaete sordida TaxID=48140 RepID=A0A9P3LFE9_9APHY|nr:nudix hydrolase domain-containing protein [Phanerochaete sordida]